MLRVERAALEDFATFSRGGLEALDLRWGETVLLYESDVSFPFEQTFLIVKAEVVLIVSALRIRWLSSSGS